MKTRKIFAGILCGAALCAGMAGAQDWGFDDDDSFGFGDDASFGSDSPITVSGTVSASVRGYVDPDQPNGYEKIDSIADMQTDKDIRAKLGVAYSGNSVDADVQLLFTEDLIKNHPADVIDELTVRGYFGDFLLEAGKMKLVWGKGDKLHVIDNFNADDYTDFIFPDYIDRRISTPMLRAQYTLPEANVSVEAVYTPFLPTDRFATSGAWVPAQVSALSGTLQEAIVTNLALLDASTAVAAYYALLARSNEITSDPSSLYPDTTSLRYNQAGIRATTSIAGVDVGASYYYGHFKQPSVNLEKYVNSAVARAKGASTPYDITGLLDGSLIDYDWKQTFGLEAATVIWHFNVRGEVAYNLTKDIAGDDPWVHNNSLQWLAGFDIDLPFWNANLNVQETGTWTLHGDKIKDGTYAAYDVDHNAKDYYTNNRLVVNFTTSFMNDKIAPEVTVMWGIENGDLILMPKLAYKPFDSLVLTASGMALFCADNSEFYAWRNNSFVNLGAKIQF